MEARLNYSENEIAEMEICKLIEEGLKDAEEGRVYEFEEVFDELTKMFGVNG